MASSIGTSHIATAVPCQDSHACALLRDAKGHDVLVLVAADGAGSAAVADVGAKLVCQRFITLVKDLVASGGSVEDIERDRVAHWLARLVERLSMRAEANGLGIEDYACTLVAAIVGEGAAAFVQVGDGAIVLSDGAERGWKYVFWPQHGEFANTTNFITSMNAASVFEFATTREAFAEIALLTDGLENLVLRKADKSVHGPFFDSMFRSVRRSSAVGEDNALSRDLERYLSTPSVVQRTDDDKTLILASRRQPERATASGAGT